MGPNVIFAASILMGLLAVVYSLKCYQCGQYNDGVGSITPCLNHTHMLLKECPHKDAWCIKYQSEGSLVRDCVGQCSERESWNTRTYCCNDADGCNSSSGLGAMLVMIVCSALFVLAH